MKRLAKSTLFGLLLLLLIAIPVFAATATFTTLEDSLPEVVAVPVYGINIQPSNNTFYAQDRHWIIYVDEDTDIVYTSAESGKGWTEHDVLANTGLYGWEVACWYDTETNHVHYARHRLANGEASAVMYRMGTPSSDGTITWAAAEQVVSLTPGELNNFRTTLCLDKNGYPWVAWIDTNGVGAYGIVYVESSSTNDGTWAEDVAQNFDSADHHAWCVSIVPVDEGADTDVVELDYTIEDQTGGPNDGLVAIWNQVYNNTGVGNWNNGDEEVVAYGLFYNDRPDAFDVYNMNDEIHLVYTANDGSTMYVIRDIGTSWETSEAYQIKYTEAIFWIPTISGYRARGAGEDLLVIVHNDDAIYRSVHIYGADDDDWDTWALTWVTPDLGNDTINRHVASYKYNSPLDFAWEYVDDSEDPDVDVLNHWWVDNENNQLGYYNAGYWIVNLAAYMFGIMTVLFLILALLLSETKYRLYAMVGGFVALIFTVLAFAIAATI